MSFNKKWSERTYYSFKKYEKYRLWFNISEKTKDNYIKTIKLYSIIGIIIMIITIMLIFFRE